MQQLVQILLLGVTFSVFGQRTIRGTVLFKTDSSTLSGIMIVEKGTQNISASDADGKFQIICHSKYPALTFSFIGLRSVEINPVDDHLTIYMEADESLTKKRIRMGIYPEYTSIGFNSGLRYTPVGVNLRNSVPYLLKVKMLTTTDFTYRTDLTKNELMRLMIRKDKVINFQYYSRYINVIFNYNRRAISTPHDHWYTKEISVIPELQFDNFLFMIGYGRQSYNDLETLQSNAGIIFGLGKYFRWHAVLTGFIKKWQNYWQTEWQFMKAFESSDFEFGLRAETLNKYGELDLVVLYRIHY